MSVDKIVMKENIKRLMKERGLTQRKLGEIIGVPQATIASWLTGRGNPKHDGLLKLSSAFGVPVHEITGEVPAEPSTLDQQLLSLPQADKKLALDFLAFLRSRRPKIGD
mgnify:CR=1 FL=1